MIEARVVREYKESTVSRIMDMVEDAQNNKAESETFTTRLSKIYTPVMFICALVLALFCQRKLLQISFQVQKET